MTRQLADDPRSAVAIGGFPGSGTRAVVALFRAVGVAALGEAGSWDSQIGCCELVNMVKKCCLDRARSWVEYEVEAPAARALRNALARQLGTYFTTKDGGPHHNRSGFYFEDAPLTTSRAALWAFKEPELMLYVPFLRSLLGDRLRLVLTLRDGRDVVLGRAFGWTNVLDASLNNTRRSPILRWALGNVHLLRWSQRALPAHHFLQLHVEDLLPAGAAAHAARCGGSDGLASRQASLQQRLLAFMTHAGHNNSPAIAALKSGPLEATLKTVWQFEGGSENRQAAPHGSAPTNSTFHNYGKWRCERLPAPPLDPQTARLMRELGYCH